jgi:hypothetical protein
LYKLVKPFPYPCTSDIFHHKTTLRSVDIHKQDLVALSVREILRRNGIGASIFAGIS